MLCSGCELGKLRQALAGPAQSLLGRLQVAIADHAQPLEHLLHLLLGVGVGDLEVAEVVEHVPQLLLQPLVAVAHPAAHLALDQPGVVQVLALRAGKAIGPGQGARGLVDGSDRLPLHGEDPRDLLAEFAAGVVELPGGILLGDDPQADLAALAQVRPLDRVEVAGIGVEGDDRADGELERFQLPDVVEFLVLDEGRLGRGRLVVGRRPERNRHGFVRFRISRRDLVEQPRGMEAEIVIQLDMDGNHGVGGNVAVGPGLGDDDAGSLIPEHLHVVAGGVAVAESLVVLKREPEPDVVLHGEAGLEAGPGRVERDALGGRLVSQVEHGGGQRLVGLGVELDLGSFQGAERGQARRQRLIGDAGVLR